MKRRHKTPGTIHEPNWIVSVIGNSGREWDPTEITVCRSAYTHGRESYGWYGENKHKIYDGARPIEPILKRLLALAHDVADELNQTQP